jgi:hypothetical protein
MNEPTESREIAGQQRRRSATLSPEFNRLPAANGVTAIRQSEAAGLINSLQKIAGAPGPWQCHGGLHAPYEQTHGL